MTEQNETAQRTYRLYSVHPKDGKTLQVAADGPPETSGKMLIFRKDGEKVAGFYWEFVTGWTDETP